MLHHRTLQEAIAPPASTVLFAWTRGTCVLQSHMPLGVEEVEPGKSAKADLWYLLMQNMVHHARVIPPGGDFSSGERIDIRIIIDKHEDNQAAALLGAIGWEGGNEVLSSAIWRASLMRVASRPADAIFSIMGLLGVNLDPMKFDPYDRKGATIALMQALLRKGECADWLAAALHVDVNPEIPTLPKFPIVDANGRALIETKDGVKPISDAMGDTWWRLVGAPTGSMDDDGTLTTRTDIIPIRRKPSSTTSDSQRIYAGAYNLVQDELDSSEVWYSRPDEHGSPYAAKLGRKERYNNAAVAWMLDTRPWLLMLVDADDRKDGQMQNLGYAEVGQEVVDSKGWVEQDVFLAGSVR